LLFAETPVPLPAGDAFTFFTQEGQAGRNGKSDEMSYLLEGIYTPSGQSNRNALCYFSWPNQTVHRLSPAGLVTGTAQASWTKFGTDFYLHSRPGFTAALYRWDLGGPQDNSFAVGVTPWPAAIVNIHRTANFLWTLESGGIIRKCNPTTLAVIASYTTGIAGSLGGFFVAGDDLIYIIAHPNVVGHGGLVNFYYFIPSTETLVLMDSILIGCPNTPANFDIQYYGFHFTSGYFYFTPQGAGIADTSTAKIGPLLCPGTTDVIGIEG
jgi:hypothetical protein